MNRKRTIVLLLPVVFMIFFGLASPAVAAPIGFATTYDPFNSNLLFSIDLGTGMPSLIGGLDIYGMALGLASDADENLFVTNEFGYFYSVDSTTGAATLIGNIGFHCEGLDFLGNTLLGVDFSGYVYSIDTTTAAVSDLELKAGHDDLYRSAAVLDKTTVMAFSSGKASSLWKLDLDTGVTTSITGAVAGPTGMDLASNGILYGLSQDGKIFQIDKDTGLTSAINVLQLNWQALAIPAAAPIPEPSTVLLLVTGLLGFTRLTRRRKG